LGDRILGKRVWVIHVTAGSVTQNQLHGLEAEVNGTTLRFKGLKKPTTVGVSSYAAHTDTDINGAHQMIDPAPSLPSPSWWEGTCDSGRDPDHIAIGSWGNLIACGPDGDLVNTRFDGGGPSVPEWECTELSERYLHLRYGISTLQANGDQVVGAAGAYAASHGLPQLHVVAPGHGQTLQPGDVVSYEPNHTNVVIGVTPLDGNGNGWYTTLAQNWNNGALGSAYQTFPVVHGSPQFPSGYVVNWLHDSTTQRPAPVPPRIGLIGQDGHFVVKEGDLRAPWTDESGIPITSEGVLSGDRIGIIGQDGHFYVKEGSLNAAWVDESAAPVLCGVLWGDRIGILEQNGHFLVKEGGLYAPWVDESAVPIKSCGVLSGDRIGIIGQDGHFYVKEGGLYANWVDESAAPVPCGVLDGTRIGILGQDSHFYVKDGSLQAANWVDESAVSIKTCGVLSGDRIGILGQNGHFYVKEGDLHANFVDESAAPIACGVLAGDRIGILGQDSHFYVKEGGLHATNWVDESGVPITSCGVLS
jgi:hypothetical protein